MRQVPKHPRERRQVRWAQKNENLSTVQLLWLEFGVWTSAAGRVWTPAHLSRSRITLQKLYTEINNHAERWALRGAAVSSVTDVAEPSGLCNKETATASYSFELCPWNLAHIPTKERLTIWLKCLMWSKIVILNSQRVPDESVEGRLWRVAYFAFEFNPLKMIKVHFGA